MDEISQRGNVRSSWEIHQFRVSLSVFLLETVYMEFLNPPGTTQLTERCQAVRGITE